MKGYHWMWLLLFIVGLVSGPLGPPAASAEPLSLHQLNNAFLDSPAAWTPKIQAAWQQLKPDRDPQAWLEHAWFLSKAEVLPPAALKQASELARERQQWLLYQQFAQETFHSNLSESQDYFVTVKLYEGLVEELRQAGDPLSLALALSGFAYFHMDNNSKERGVPLIKEARNLLQSNPSALLTIYDDIENNYALALLLESQDDAAFTVYRGMVETFKKKKLRYAWANSLNQLGFSYIKATPSGPVDPKAFQYLTESLQVATELQDKIFIARAEYSLSVACSRNGEHDRAIELAQKSLEYFVNAQSKHWIAKGYLRLAKALISGGRFQESLSSLDQATKEFDPVNKSVLNDLVWLRVQAYQGLKKYEEALNQLLIYNQTMEEIFEAQSAKESERVAADIGLHFQTERNTLLASQNAMQAEQISLLQKFRVLAFIIAGLLISVLFLFFRLVKQSKEVRASRQKMKDLLDTIDEGILTLDRNLLVIPGYSPHLDRLFATHEQTLADIPVVDLLFGTDLKSTDKRQVQETLLACVGKEFPAWEQNSASLPVELQHNDRILHLHWQALISRQEISGFLLAIRDITDWKKREQAIKSAAIIERLNSEIRSRSLQDQMQPHFLFNSLNVISNLVYKSVDEASIALEKLADLYRLILESSKAHTWKFSEEIRLVEDYLELQVIRFEDKVKYSIETGTIDLENIAFPCLLLHTLVENSFKHGLSLNMHGGRININISESEGGYFIIVEDSGSGELAKTHVKGTGTGLENTRTRLLNMYGTKSHFSADFSSEGSKVSFWISGDYTPAFVMDVS